MLHILTLSRRREATAMGKKLMSVISIITPTMRGGKVIGRVVVVVSRKIAISRGLGI